ncbi:MAG: HEPN domain-containing protein [Verrucomicrobia bacterium]|nr:HEPN domain-containing protein [Verrucomicrobiota bacterium]
MSKQSGPAEICREDLCFQAQQAAEKSIKAVYQSKKLVFRYTHNIEELLTHLERSGVVIPDQIKAASELTHYAVEARYPALTEPVSEEEYHEAIRLAEAVVEWAGQMIQQVAKTENSHQREPRR